MEKYSQKNPDIVTCEISNEITGKEFWDMSLKYGRVLFTNQNNSLNAFCGIGLIYRKTNREKSFPVKSTEEFIAALPVELSYNQRVYKNFGICLSAFSDLNFEELLSGIIFNLQFALK